MQHLYLKWRWALIIFLCFYSFAVSLGQSVERTIRLHTITGMQFDQVQLTASPGETLRFILVNQDEMGHNFLITKPDRRQKVVEAALALVEKGPELHYIPASDDVLGSLPVVYPGDSASFVFKVPSQVGVYPYVCTYPGHGYFMYGALYVGDTPQVPVLERDLNIPETRRVTVKKTTPVRAVASQTDHEHSQLHPYETIPPYLYRVFIEGSSLASIAVRLPEQLAFCWDASLCKLQFAWSGDFLDNTDFWHGHKNAYAKVLGTVFYRDKTDYPLRIGNRDAVPSVSYKGYRLINRYPEFHYTVNGYEVKEIIKEKRDGSGLVREFQIVGGIEPVWFVFDGNDGIRYESQTGRMMGNNQILYTPKEAQSFTITMTR